MAANTVEATSGNQVMHGAVRPLSYTLCRSVMDKIVYWHQLVIHGDVHIGQFMLTADNTLAILDFGGCCIGDPAQDLADMIIDPHLSNFEGAMNIHARHNRLQLINKAYCAAITQQVDWHLKIPELISLAASDVLLNNLLA